MTLLMSVIRQTRGTPCDVTIKRVIMLKTLNVVMETGLTKHKHIL